MSVMYVYNNKMSNEELVFSFKLNRNKLTEERTLELLPIISLILISVFMVYTVISVGNSYMSSINFQKALNKESEAIKFLNSKENKIEKLEDKKTLVGLYKEAYNLALESNKNQTRDYSLRQLSVYALYIVLNNQRKVDSTDKVLTDDELNGYLTSLADANGSVNLSMQANPNNYSNYESGSLIFQQLYNLNQSIVKDNKDSKDVALKDRPYFTQALSLANASLKLNPTRIDTMLVLGQLLTASSSQEDITTAKNLFETAYRLNRSNLNSVSLLGQFYEATANYTTAKQLYTFTKENFVQKDSELYKNLDSKIVEMDKKIAESTKK
jgi:tetratricopeptide (TPR) repeat protein